MTTKTLFNKGIYKSTVKRFTIGSVFYFLLMFFCTGLMIMLSYDSGYEYYNEGKWILESFILDVSFAISLVVPTVVALLVYRFLHSKKMSVFVHSIPVTRGQNYISTLAASFTLMGVPIILNGVILILMSLTEYGKMVSLESCFAWMGVNLITVFIMFSFSTFVSMLTGNSFAVIVLNIFIYTVLPIISSVSDVLFRQFLFGYANDSPLTLAVIKMNPVAVLSYMETDIRNEVPIDYVSIYIHAAVAVIIYVISFLIYRKRNIESSEDVAAFRVLNPIFKYVVTSVGTLLAFALFISYMPVKPVNFVITVVILSAVIYFASEMILKKQIKVWYTYKGFIAFGAVFSFIMGFLMLTSVFGYETYVPKTADIKTAAIYNYYYQDLEPFTDSGEINEYITKIHSDLVEKDNITVLNHTYDAGNGNTRIHIAYELKNGRNVQRVYNISYDKRDEIMEKLYTYPEYKHACEEVFRKDIVDVLSVEINGEEIPESLSELNKFLRCVKRDAEKLSYKDLRVFEFEDGSHINEGYIGTCYLQCTLTNGNIGYITFELTEKYEESIKWLSEKGYELKVDEKELG